MPKTIRVDNGPEFISRNLDLWAYTNNVTLDFSRPGKPTDNSFVEAFNGKVRAECIDQNWLLSLADAPGKMRGVQTRLQYAKAAQLDRQQNAVRVHEVHRLPQPADDFIGWEIHRKGGPAFGASPSIL